MDVIEDHSLSLIEADLEMPLLPINLVTLLTKFRNYEAGAFRLNNVQWLQIRPELISLRNILIRGLDLVRRRLFDSVVSTSREEIDPGNFHGFCTDNWRNA